jgi:hypothetical protein
MHSTTKAGSYTLLVDTATRVTQAIQSSNAIAWMDVSSSGPDVGVEPADGIQPGVVAVWRQQSEAPIRWGDVIFPIETRSDPEDRATGQPQLFTYICLFSWMKYIDYDEPLRECPKGVGWGPTHTTDVSHAKSWDTPPCKKANEGVQGVLSGSASLQP